MLSSYLLSSTGIALFSTGIYYLISDRKKKELNEDRKMDNCIIFSIIFIVSLILLFLSGKNTGQIVPLERERMVTNNPPF